ncbi:MAG TPA: helix-turn-helix domain-containing protein [Longimicrobiales bacterium]|nr:helix-turn-helix domain-containing protein [Longimicrobiales bacterium]
MRSIQPITSASRAASILAHPLRVRILRAAQTPISASGLARILNEPRQRLNYHVRQLAANGFLEPAGEQRRGNMMEQQYVASAAAYVLTTDVLGDAAPQPTDSTHTSTAEELVAICARAESEVASVIESARAAGVRAKTFALQFDVRFSSAEQRSRFNDALRDALERIIAEVSAVTGDEGAARPFRMVVGLYPAASSQSNSRRQDA